MYALAESTNAPVTTEPKARRRPRPTAVTANAVTALTSTAGTDAV